MKQWNKDWKSSTDPSKQRKYRENAPGHVQDKLVSINVGQTIRDHIGSRSISPRNGDRVEVMRGDRKGASGIINQIDKQREKVYIQGIESAKNDGSKSQIPVHPSNLQVVALNLEHPERMEKYDAEQLEEIKVEEEEVEEALEQEEQGQMMEQMQTGESSLTEQEEQEQQTEDSEQEEQEEQVEEVVESTVEEVKQKVKDQDLDVDRVLEAEKQNKNRKTLKSWLEKQ